MLLYVFWCGERENDLSYFRGVCRFEEICRFLFFKNMAFFLGYNYVYYKVFW